MRGSKLPIETAATVLAMNDLVGNGAEVARRMDLKPRTVQDIIAGHDRWGEIASGPIATKLRAEQKNVLTIASRSIAAQCLNQVQSQLHKASSYQAAGIYGLMRTHERLDMGEATENVAIVARVDANNADGLAQRLASRLVRDGS